MLLDFLLATGTIGLSLSYLIIFYRALVVNGNGQTTVDVNKYHEGWIEVVMLCVLLALGIYKFMLLAGQI